MNLPDLGRHLLGRQERCCSTSEPCECRSCRTSYYPNRCDGVMVLRMRGIDKELFWGCSRFPACVHTYPFDILQLPLSLRQKLAA